MSSATTLKEQKEAFVTGHSGTTPHEILLVCLSAPIGIFLFNEIRCLLLSSCRALGSRGEANVAKAKLVAVESFVLLLPMAICQTRLLYPWGVAVLCFEVVLGMCIHIYRRMSRSSDAGFESVNNNERASSSQLTFLSSYRSTVSYLTFVAILAVDFHVFPRRFAKTETAGYGLMDVGAGSFVVSGGFVSWYARRRRAKPSGGDGNEGGRKTYLSVLAPVLIRSVPLVLIGTIRLVTNKGLEYQEHVSEYGVYWNFFFTLAVVGLLSSMIRFDGMESFGDNFMQKAFPLLLLALHQTALSVYEMQEYIENGPRHCRHGGALCDFFAANREGILGSIGYLCMHFISEDIATYCLWRCPSSAPGASTDNSNGEAVRGRRLLASCAVLWGLHWILSTILDIPVSRRSTNASFVCWTLAHNVTILTLIWAAFYVSEGAKPAVSPIFDAVNRHGLIVFILANLMTGLVNLTMNTLDVTDQSALGVIFGYLFAVGAVALLIDWGLSRRRTKQD